MEEIKFRAWDKKENKFINYLQNLGLQRIFKDSRESKKAMIDPNAQAQVGGIAIWRPAGGQPKYGHVGIVTGVSPDGKSAYITDWNWKNDGKIDENRRVPISEIEASGGFFNPLGNKQAQGLGIDEYNLSDNYSQEEIALARSIGNGDMKASDLSGMKNKGKILALSSQMKENGDFKAEVGDNEVVRDEEMISTLNWLLDKKQDGTRESATGKVNWSWSNWWAGDRDDYLAKMNFLLDNETLTALAKAKAGGITFGALSGQELETVQKSASFLNGLAERDKGGKITGFNGSEKAFKDELIKIRDAYRRAYDKKLKTPIYNKDNVIKNTIIDFSKDK